MPGDRQHLTGEARTDLEMKLASAEGRIRQLKSELSLLRSDLIRVALAVGGGRAPGSTTA
jgi:hypothetical protein